MAPKVISVAWDHFTDKGQQMAECNICKIQFSFKSSVSNLTKHLKRKHPFVSLVRRNDVPAPVIAAQTNQQSSTSNQPAGIVQQSEGEERPSTNLVKTTVAYFKRSAQAWEKLKKYQEQAGKSPKRPLQCVSTRWNSTFYMLQRFVELKEEVNSALSNLNAISISLTAVEWKLCEHICNILKPCEEVTREVSAQKYITGSLVIPITTGLVKSLENINSNTYLDTAQKLQQDLLAAIKNRFIHLDKSGTFTTCMFLDPRFKLYFEDQYVADTTKQRIIEMITTIINKEDRNYPQIENEEQQLSDQAANPPPQLQINLVWQHYAEKMKNIQPKGTATSRAILEVQRYLDDKVVLPSENISPLEWWKRRKDVYPHLYALALKKLNAMATSVPCERLFSSCGLLLNDRRTRLGTRKVQQLMFLNQNS
ncbi:unnamed protein product [Parnassius apollo]|uniref:(apollo) hypothetical protein n=1 Tax=Parnassius apollo TaxID=110799 RepID=A0A8S3WXZ8_PARAO|nr:unnamed protein product [Parnassius apollo]